MPLLPRPRRRRRLLLAISLSALLAFTVLHTHTHTHTHPRRKELVVASVTGDNTAWIAEHLPDWGRSVYVADDPHAPLTVPVNKGREAMVYLTFIIDNYSNLPEFMVFMHGLRYQWHNDDPLYDSVAILRALQLPHLAARGYVNLRCVWLVGCPTVHAAAAATADVVFAAAFAVLFPAVPVPDVVAVSCCAQFALTRDAALARPRADYVRYREWLRQTPLSDALSGRVLEYSWHMVFGMAPVHCPDVRTCYCRVFGKCDGNCSERACEGWYTLPRYTTLPEGWPEVGWAGSS